MKNNRVQNYLDYLPFTFKELYWKIFEYKLSRKELKRSGFPLVYKNQPKTVTVYSDSIFSSSQDASKQICRCGKKVSLLKKGWYKDDSGCSYHSGKRIFCEGPENGRFSCCNGISQENGCVRHKYHVSSFRFDEKSNFARTKFKKKSLKSAQNVFGLDCEMVYTASGMEVVQVSVVTLYGEVVYHSFVKPSSFVLDFNTAFSGVSAEDLKGVTTKLPDVQLSLLEFLDSNSILVGHGLENDLLGLRLLHEKIVDTSLVFAHERGFPMRHSLKYLASKYLAKDIHTDIAGHSSVEDAKISLELILHKIYQEAVCNDETKYISMSGTRFLPHNFKMFTSLCVPNPFYLPPFFEHPRRRRPRNGRHYLTYLTPVFPVVPMPCRNQAYFAIDPHVEWYDDNIESSELIKNFEN